MTTKLSTRILFGIMLAAIIAMFAFIQGRTPTAIGSIQDGQGYFATTTSTGTFTYPGLLKTGPGIFGSVIITGAAAGVINVYDATTTNISLRTGQLATSTILLATFPASTAAGTYTFDRNFNYGLIYDMIGTSPTTTATFK